MPGLAEENRRQWATDGYLLVRGALSKNERMQFNRVVDRLYRKHAPPDKKAGSRAKFDRRNALADDNLFIELMHHPATFDLVIDLLGPNIQLSMAEVLVRPPDRGYKGYIHTDGGQAMNQIRVTETSRPLQIKVQYFLTDVSFL